MAAPANGIASVYAWRISRNGVVHISNGARSSSTKSTTGTVPTVILIDEIGRWEDSFDIDQILGEVRTTAHMPKNELSEMDYMRIREMMENFRDLFDKLIEQDKVSIESTNSILDELRFILNDTAPDMTSTAGARQDLRERALKAIDERRKNRSRKDKALDWFNGYGRSD